MDVTETKQFRYVHMVICDERPFALYRRHKGHGLEVAEVYGIGNNPVSLKETIAYLPLRLAPNQGAGLAIIERIDKFKGSAQFVVYDGQTEELFEVRQLAEGRIAEIQSRAPKPVAAPAPPRRSHRRRVSV